MRVPFDGTFEGAAFEDDFGWSKLMGSVRRRISPEVIQAFAVILGALLEERRPDRQQAERERLAYEAAQRERIRRAEQGVKTRRRNAPKPKTTKKRKAKRK